MNNKIIMLLNKFNYEEILFELSFKQSLLIFINFKKNDQIDIVFIGNKQAISPIVF